MLVDTNLVRTPQSFGQLPYIGEQLGYASKL